MNDNNRRRFVKGVVATGACLAASRCTWTYRGIHSYEGLKEGDDGFLVATKDVPENKVVLVYLKDGTPVIVLKSQDAFKAYKSICPHTSCELNDGERYQPLALRRNEIRCYLHDSYFEIETGKRTKGPAPAGSSLPVVPLRVENGNIYRS